MPKHVALYGKGNIGAEAFRQLGVEGYNVVAVATRHGVSARDNRQSVSFSTPPTQAEIIKAVDAIWHRPDLVLMAIPSGGSGDDELETMLHNLRVDIPVVTAGKAALSQHFAKLQPFLPNLGINASVGGGVRILHELLERLRLEEGRQSLVQLVINGTIMFSLNSRHGGRPQERIIREAVKLGYAEPRSDMALPSWHEMFVGEIADIVKKCVIILNAVYFKRTRRIFTTDDIKKVLLGEHDLQMFTGTASRYAYVVNISTNDHRPEIAPNSPGSIWFDQAGVRLWGGFHPFPSDSPLGVWIPRLGPGNGMDLDQAGAEFRCSGDGAGDLATVGTMMFDARRLCSPTE